MKKGKRIDKKNSLVIRNTPVRIPDSKSPFGKGGFRGIWRLPGEIPPAPLFKRWEKNEYWIFRDNQKKTDLTLKSNTVTVTVSLKINFSRKSDHAQNPAKARRNRSRKGADAGSCTRADRRIRIQRLQHAQALRPAGDCGENHLQLLCQQG